MMMMMMQNRPTVSLKPRSAYEEFEGDTPVNGNRTPVNGNHTPVNGNHTPVSGNYTPVSGNYTQ